jgi:hypothetical protein
VRVRVQKGDKGCTWLVAKSRNIAAPFTIRCRY